MKKRHYPRQFKFEEKNIAIQYQHYLKQDDILEGDKLSYNDFSKLYTFSFGLSQLIAKHNPFNFHHRKVFNISYALLSLSDKNIVLVDISGWKEQSYERRINNFISQLGKDALSDPDIKKLKAIMEEGNFSAEIVLSVSKQNWNQIYLGDDRKNKKCSEGSLYIELEKYFQAEGNLPVKTVNFIVKMTVDKFTNKLIIMDYTSQGSCRECRHKKDTLGFYSARNSVIIDGVVLCDNPSKLNKPGNIGDRPLSPPRTRPILSTKSSDNNLNKIPRIIEKELTTTSDKNKAQLEKPRSKNKNSKSSKSDSPVLILAKSLQSILQLSNQKVKQDSVAGALKCLTASLNNLKK